MATPRITTQLLTRIFKWRVEPIYRKSILMGLLRAKGRIKFNHTVNTIDWQARYRRQDLAPIEDVFRPVMGVEEPQLYQNASLPIRGYKMGTSIGLMERLLSGDRKTTHADFVGRIPKQMADDFIEGYRLDLYNDGDVNTTRLSGIETWFNQSGLLASGYVGTPSGSYGGLSSVWADFGGEWTGVWPDGTGDAEYHFWSQMVVDITNALFAGTTATWADQWQQVINFAWEFLRTIQDTNPDVIIVAPNMIRQARDSLIGKQNLEITQHSDLVKLGHKTVTMNGIELASEYGVPDATGYCLSFDKMRLVNVLGELIATEMDREIRTLQDLRVLYNVSNLQTDSPAFHAKLEEIS